jgi:hypothetical protein
MTTNALIFFAAFSATSRHHINAQTSSSVTVTYEYQLEVNNINGNGNQSDLAVGTTSSTQDMLSFMDRNILGSLQEMLPNGGITASSNETSPNIKFFDIKSEMYSECFTSSDQCSLVRSSILVTYEGEKPKHAVERVSYRLVRQYLEDFASGSSGQVVITYMYPMIVSSLAQFRLTSVETTMGDVEIQTMENSFLEVFGATVAAMEGDTEITYVGFIYQDVNQVDPSPSNGGGDDDNNRLRGRLLNPLSTLEADFFTHGYCRECTEKEYASVVNSEITANLVAFVHKLKLNGEVAGSSYFTNVDEIAFDVPDLPPGLPKFNDGSLYDSEPPQTKSSLPWYFYFGIVTAIGVIICGVYIVYKDLRDLDDEKDEFSTSSESDFSEERDENSRRGSGSGVAEYGTPAGRPTSREEYQVEAILSDDDNNAYNTYTRKKPRRAQSYRSGSKKKYDDSYGYQ